MKRVLNLRSSDKALAPQFLPMFFLLFLLRLFLFCLSQTHLLLRSFESQFFLFRLLFLKPFCLSLSFLCVFKLLWWSTARHFGFRVLGFS